MIVCKLMKDNVLLTGSHSFSTSLMDPQDKANNVYIHHDINICNAQNTIWWH